MAAITLAEAGASVVVYEARQESVGGGAGTEQLTIPGRFHDVCSAYIYGCRVFCCNAWPLKIFGLNRLHP